MATSKVVYCGGLESSVTEEVLRAAFIPFGPVRDIHIPLDPATQSNRGFGFVEFEDEDDLEAALDNMDGAELYGRTLKVNVARPMRGGVGGANQPAWASADAWYQHKLKAEGEGRAAAKGTADPAAAAGSGGEQEGKE